MNLMEQLRRLAKRTHYSGGTFFGATSAATKEAEDLIETLDKASAEGLSKGEGQTMIREPTPEDSKD